MRADKLQQSILSSYFNLRVGVAVLGILFPLVLWIGGHLKGIEFQSSMSAYYHATDELLHVRSMRDFFVGILFAVGFSLYLYKGSSDKENIVLNLAALFAIGVAIFPMPWNCGNQCPKITVHGVCAYSLFLCMAFVCLFCNSETLPELKDETLKTRFRGMYLILGIIMILSPLAAFLLAVVFRKLHEYKFVAEATGIAVFSIYWMVKTWELSLSKVERLEAFRDVKS
jgi:hypothetical protein